MTIRIQAGDEAYGHAVIDAAFAEIAKVHRLMSYQSADSDLTLINREAWQRRVTVDPQTLACLKRALAFADQSCGAFDPTVVEAGASGTWTDIEVDSGGVRFARDIRVDLSGIAKGFAVDEACNILANAGVSSAIVNAGGDLRCLGAAEEQIALAAGDAETAALITIADGALASSEPSTSCLEQGRECHFDGRTRQPVVDRFVSVAAPLCVDADALTKVVLALGDNALPILQRYDAFAYIHDASGWSTVNEVS